MSQIKIKTATRRAQMVGFLPQKILLLLDGGSGRGLCVWFNQSSTFQTAELGFATIAQAREAGVPCNSDSSSLISQGFFPLA